MAQIITSQFYDSKLFLRTECKNRNIKNTNTCKNRNIRLCRSCKLPLKHKLQKCPQYINASRMNNLRKNQSIRWMTQSEASRRDIPKGFYIYTGYNKNVISGKFLGTNLASY